MYKAASYTGTHVRYTESISLQSQDNESRIICTISLRCASHVVRVHVQTRGRAVASGGERTQT